MPLANCPRCKKMFNRMSVSVCNECEPLEEQEYQKVRKIIEVQPDLSVDKAAELAQVDAAVIKRMMTQGILTSVSADQKFYCGKCGAPAISASKRLCQACLDRLNLQVAEVQRSLIESIPPPATHSSKMSVRRRIDDRKD